MAKFTLATLDTPNGPKAAIGAGEKYYLLEAVQPVLSTATCKTLLQSWQTSLPLLEHLAEELSNGGNSHPADIAPKQPHCSHRLCILTVFSPSARTMLVTWKKWASMPFFIRPPRTTLVGPGETVNIPKTTKQFDWECELAVFVGKNLRNASMKQAAAAIAGYAIGLDLSCRDLIQVNNDLKVDLVRGKAQDTMAPCSPYIMPAKFVNDLLKPGDRIHAEIEQVGVLDVTMREQ